MKENDYLCLLVKPDIQVHTCSGWEASTNTVRNPGVILDQDMSFSVHITQIHLCDLIQFHNITKIRNSLLQSHAVKLVHGWTIVLFTISSL